MNPEDRAKAEEVARRIVGRPPKFDLTEFDYYGLKKQIIDAILPLLEQNRELVECLGPFAEVAKTLDYYKSEWANTASLANPEFIYKVSATLADCRRAADLLSRLQPGKDL